LVEGAARLCAEGHGPAALNYTPAQVVAYSALAARRQQDDLQASFAVARVAAHGDEKSVKAFLAALESGK
jgi:hypothetical protein